MIVSTVYGLRTLAASLLVVIIDIRDNQTESAPSLRILPQTFLVFILHCLEWQNC